MFISKRAIPRLATSGLVLGAAACGGDDDPTPSSIAHDYCFGTYECDYALFYTRYADTSQCLDAVSAFYQNQADAWALSVDGACADAYLDYKGCYWSEYHATCNAIAATDVCLDVEDRFLALCY